MNNIRSTWIVLAVWCNGVAMRWMHEDGVTPQATLVAVFSVVFLGAVIALISWMRTAERPQDAAKINRLERTLADRNEAIRLSNEVCAKRSRKRRGEEE